MPSKLSPEQLDLMRFQGSDQYKRILSENAFLDAEDLSKERSKVVYFQDENDKPWLSIVFEKHGRVYASLRAIRVADAKVGTVGRQYVTSLIKYEEFDFIRMSGKITLVDTDDQSIEKGRFELIEGRITKNLRNDPAARTHYCDANRNGNVTWTECFTCMLGACMSNAECAVQCAIYDVINTSCTRSMDLACAVLSVIY